MRQKKRKNKGGEEAKSKSQDCCVTFKPQNSKFCFLRMPELRKLIFCISIRRPRRVRPVNGFVVKLQNAFYGKISRGEWVIKWGQDFSSCVISWFCGNRERVWYHMVHKQPRVCVHRYHMIMRQRRTWRVSQRQVCSVRASSPPGVSCERHVRGDALSCG